MLGEQLAQDLLRSRLVEVLDGVGHVIPRAVDGEEPLHAHGLRDDRLELVVRDVDGVDALADEVVVDGLGDVLRGFQRERLKDLRRLATDGDGAAAEEVVRLAADRQQLHRGPVVLAHGVLRGLDHVRVERAAEALV